MISVAARWHLKRRQAMLRRYPQIANLPKHNALALIPIMLTPLIYGMLAYCSQFLTLGEIALLAWAIGSRCNFCKFKYAHEISHHLVSPNISKQHSHYLLRYLNLFNLSTSVYLLFSFGHKPHHASLGATTIAQAKRFLTEKYPDIELLIDRYYYELPYEPDSPPESLSPRLYDNRLLRFLSIGIIYPITSMLKGTMLFHLIFTIKYLQGLRAKKNALYRRRLNIAMVQITLLYGGLFGLYLLAGINALLFMIISDLSQRGFLWHPISTFTISSHKTWNSKGKIQPTTSTYGTSLTFILMKMNYHVEHHDFPDIPCKFLPRLKQIAPEFYLNINNFKGYAHIMTDYLKSEHWLYAGGGEKSS
jgi:sphingolipid 4-desaturase/C4-monooxygenase